VRAALVWLEQSGDAAALLRLAGALWPFWHRHSHRREGRGWLERALDPTRSTSAPAALRVRPLYGAAYLARNRGDYERATALATACLALSEELGDERAASRARQLLAFVALAQGDYERVTAHAAEALALSAALGKQSGWTAWVLSDLGMAAYGRGELARAEEILEEALALYRTFADPFGTALTLGYLGLVACDRGEQAVAAVVAHDRVCDPGAAMVTWPTHERRWGDTPAALIWWQSPQISAGAIRTPVVLPVGCDIDRQCRPRRRSTHRHARLVRRSTVHAGNADPPRTTVRIAVTGDTAVDVRSAADLGAVDGEVARAQVIRVARAMKIVPARRHARGAGAGHVAAHAIGEAGLPARALLAGLAVLAAGLPGESQLAPAGGITAAVRAGLRAAGGDALSRRVIAGLVRGATATGAAGTTTIIPALPVGAVRGTARALGVALVGRGIATAVTARQRPVAARLAGAPLGRWQALFGGVTRPARTHLLGAGEVEAVVRTAVAVLAAVAARRAALAAANALAALPLAFAIVFVLPRAVAAAPSVPLAFGLRGCVIELTEQPTQAHTGQHPQQPAPGAGGTHRSGEAIKGRAFHTCAQSFRSAATNPDSGRPQLSRHPASLAQRVAFSIPSGCLTSP
jgi:hypothetical protein